MINNRFFFSFLVALMVVHLAYSPAWGSGSKSLSSLACDIKSKVTGFSAVQKTTAKAYFYKEPKACEKGKSTCASQRKAYLVPGNFVQTAQVEKEFVCAIFRNFDGHGGKETVGWIAIENLEPIRNVLERKDLVGSWGQVPCGENDDCMITVSESDKHVLEIDGTAHLHQHPMELLNVSHIAEKKGQLILTGTVTGVSDQPKKITITYDAINLEPGTISVSGDESFDGIYRK